MHLKHFPSLSSEFRQQYCDDDTQIQDAWGGGEVGGGDGVSVECWGGDWAVFLYFSELLSELLFVWADVLLLVDKYFVLLPFSSTGLL